MSPEVLPDSPPTSRESSVLGDIDVLGVLGQQGAMHESATGGRRVMRPGRVKMYDRYPEVVRDRLNVLTRQPTLTVHVRDGNGYSREGLFFDPRSFLAKDDNEVRWQLFQKQSSSKNDKGCSLAIQSRFAELETHILNTEEFGDLVELRQWDFAGVARGECDITDASQQLKKCPPLHHLHHSRWEAVLTNPMDLSRPELVSAEGQLMRLMMTMESHSERVVAAKLYCVLMSEWFGTQLTWSLVNQTTTLGCFIATKEFCVGYDTCDITTNMVRMYQQQSTLMSLWKVFLNLLGM